MLTLTPARRHHIAGADVVVLDTLWLKPEAHKSHFGLEQVRMCACLQCVELV